LLIRTFIIFHDCGHGSCFRSKRANSFWGFVCGVLTFTPYCRWRWEHARHHASSGNLDRRGIGDIWTMTVQEYLDASRWRRCAYRLVRNPLLMFIIGPLFLMLIVERCPSAHGNRRERQSVWWMNLAIVIMVAGLSSVFGLVPYLVIQLIILSVAGSAGVWLFYVQHQFEETYWAESGAWCPHEAALRGSSHYDLPGVLRWFTANIGMHHVHHLASRIPYYHLPRVLHDHPELAVTSRLTLWQSLGCVRLALWDETQNRLVTFREAARHSRG
jgi:omega-6 fatty acid desaturase (delta-12 desaturase)